MLTGSNVSPGTSRRPASVRALPLWQMVCRGAEKDGDHSVTRFKEDHLICRQLSNLSREMSGAWLTKPRPLQQVVSHWRVVSTGPGSFGTGFIPLAMRSTPRKTNRVSQSEPNRAYVVFLERSEVSLQVCSKGYQFWGRHSRGRKVYVDIQLEIGSSFTSPASTTCSVQPSPQLLPWCGQYLIQF